MSSVLRVWCNFTVKTKNGELKLRIQDVPNDLVDNVSEMFATHFAAGETFHKIAGITKTKESQEECKEFNKYFCKDSKITICCLDDDTDLHGVKEIIGASLVTLTKKDDPEEEFDFKAKTKEMQRLFELMTPMFEMYDAIKQLELDSLYDDRGVVVHSDYRGLGIAEKLFNVRRLMCKEEGVQMTGAWMTGFGSQKAAERDGWETVFEISNEEYGKLVDITFDAAPPTFKYMVAKPL